MLCVEPKYIGFFPENGKECFCGDPAVRYVVIGAVGSSWGNDYEICSSETCLEFAMDNEIKNLQDQVPDWKEKVDR